MMLKALAVLTLKLILSTVIYLLIDILVFILQLTPWNKLSRKNILKYFYFRAC